MRKLMLTVDEEKVQHQINYDFPCSSIFLPFYSGKINFGPHLVLILALIIVLNVVTLCIIKFNWTALLLIHNLNDRISCLSYFEELDQEEWAIFTAGA